MFAFPNVARASLAALGLLLALPTPGVAATAPASTSSNCFLSTDWAGWKSPSPNVIYLRVRVNTVYRLDLATASNDLDEPFVHLVNKVRGSDWICSPLDLDLQLVDDHGAFREPLIVKSLTRLTPAEAQAIPPKFRP